MDKHIRNTDSPNSELSNAERLGYGVGSLSNKLIFGIIGAFLAIYMTNVVMLDIAAISTIIAVSKIFDGISDIVVGNIIDSTVSAFGKARVWMLRMCLPLSLSALLLFHVPQLWPDMVRYIYVFIMYNLVTTVFLTFMQVSHYSLLSLITDDPDEQGSLSSIMSFFMFAAQLLTGTFFVKMLAFFSDDAGNQNTQRGYTYSILIFCIIAVAASLITVFSTRERVTERSRENSIAKSSSLKAAGESMKALTSHRYWVILMIIHCTQSIMSQTTVMGGSYFAMYILGDMDHLSWLIGLMMLSVMAVQFINPVLMRRFGKKRVLIAGSVVILLSQIGLMIALPDIPAIKLNVLLRGCGIGLWGGAFYGLLAEVVAYTNNKTGVYAAGTASAGISATEKLGQGLGSVIVGISLGAAGFSGTLGSQPDAVISAIKYLIIWIPFFASLINALVAGCFFDLGEKQAGEE